MKIVKVSDLVSIKRSIESGTTEQLAVVKKSFRKFVLLVMKRYELTRKNLTGSH